MNDGTDPRAEKESPMDTTHIAAFLRSLPRAASRRGLFAGLAGGLLAASPFAWLADDSDARKRGKRRRKQGRKKRRDRKGPKVRIAATCSGSGTLASNADSGTSRIAQTFVALASGTLSKARLPIFNAGGATDDFELRLTPVDASGIPTNEVLAVGSVATDQAPIAGEETEFAFTTPFAVVAGVEYALVLTRPGGNGFAWFGDEGRACPGRSFFSVDQTAPFETNVAEIDQTFTAFVAS